MTGAINPVFGHAAGDVRVMMLNGDQRQLVFFRPLAGPRCGEVAGVQIVHDYFRLDLKRVHQVSQRLLEELKACQIFEIAEVLALVGELSPRQRKDILEMPADSQQWRALQRQRHGKRHKPARSANQLRRAIDNRSDRVVAALKDLAVVHQESIGNAAETGSRFVVVDGNGLFAEIRRGHHERLHARIGKEQMLQRRIRKKDAEPRNPRRDRRGDAVADACARQAR